MIELSGDNLREKYRTGGRAKKGKAQTSGNSGIGKGYANPPRGIRCHPKGKTRYK